MTMRPATVLAGIALFISLTGNAVAIDGLITSKNIKDGTIQLVDLSPSARAALRGTQGPVGPQGPAGPQGAAGQTANTFTLESRISSLEFKTSQTDSKLGRVCAFGKVVHDVSVSSFSNSLNVSYAFC